MKPQGWVITAWGLSGDRGPAFSFDGLPLVGVVFFPSSSLMEVLLFPSYAINGIVLGNVFEGGGVL